MDTTCIAPGLNDQLCRATVHPTSVHMCFASDDTSAYRCEIEIFKTNSLMSTDIYVMSSFGHYKPIRTQSGGMGWQQAYQNEKASCDVNRFVGINIIESSGPRRKEGKIREMDNDRFERSYNVYLKELEKGPVYIRDIDKIICLGKHLENAKFPVMTIDDIDRIKREVNSLTSGIHPISVEVYDRNKRYDKVYMGVHDMVVAIGINRTDTSYPSDTIRISYYKDRNLEGLAKCECDVVSLPASETIFSPSGFEYGDQIYFFGTSLADVRDKMERRKYELKSVVTYTQKELEQKVKDVEKQTAEKYEAVVRQKTNEIDSLTTSLSKYKSIVEIDQMQKEQQYKEATLAIKEKEIVTSQNISENKLMIERQKARSETMKSVVAVVSTVISIASMCYAFLRTAKKSLRFGLTALRCFI